MQIAVADLKQLHLFYLLFHFFYQSDSARSWAEKDVGGVAVCLPYFLSVEKFHWKSHNNIFLNDQLIENSRPNSAGLVVNIDFFTKALNIDASFVDFDGDI